METIEAARLILEKWKQERDELDAQITMLEKWVMAHPDGISSAGSSRKIGPDEFFRMTTPDAVKKYLKIVGKPARATTDIIDGLKAGGMNTNYTNVYTALGRLQKKGVVKVGDNWGLEEWYPPAPRENKTTNGKEEDATAVAEESSAEEIEETEQQKESEK